MNSLFTRVTSALVALALILVLTFFAGVKGFFALGLLVSALGILEYSHIIFKHTPVPLIFRISFALTAFLLLLVAIFEDAYLLPFFGLALSLFFTCSLWGFRSNSLPNEKLLSLFANCALGYFYCALLPSFLIKILAVEHGLKWFWVVLFVVFIGDVGAYFGGSLIGGPKLIPSLSPNKTISGSISGGLASMVAGTLAGYILLPQVSPLFFLFISFFGGMIAQSGDLFESLMKRVAQVKDSGSLMPGHGGVLDRIDGLLFAAPFFYICINYF